jgi:hypothetical protein
MNPILPGAIHPDLAGEMPEKSFLLLAGLFRGAQEVKPTRKKLS